MQRSIIASDAWKPLVGNHQGSVIQLGTHDNAGPMSVQHTRSMHT